MKEFTTKEKAQVKATEAEEVLKAYNAQTEDESVHFYHVDGYTYGDYSDSCCC